MKAMSLRRVATECRGNQWALLKSFQVDTDYVEITPWGQYNREMIPTTSSVSFEGVAPATEQILHALGIWMRNPMELAELPAIRSEWLCLYCGAAQKVERVKCENCGAPRSWLL